MHVQLQHGNKQIGDGVWNTNGNSNASTRCFEIRALPLSALNMSVVSKDWKLWMLRWRSSCTKAGTRCSCIPHGLGVARRDEGGDTIAIVPSRASNTLDLESSIEHWLSESKNDPVVRSTISTIRSLSNLHV